MKITDETLAAFVDGELDEAQTAELEAQAARDPALAARVAAQRRLRAALAGAHAGVLDEPVPERLLSQVRGGAQIVDLGQVRAARAPRRRSPWALPAAMAASVALGMIVGWAVRPAAPGALIGGRPGDMVAQGPLAAALDRQLAGKPSAGAPVRIGVSFRSTDRLYCRTFRVDRGDGMAGVACRGPQGWRVRAAVAEPPAGARPAYRTAASDLPAALASAVDGMIDGAPLDDSGETAARAKGWRN